MSERAHNPEAPEVVQGLEHADERGNPFTDIEAPDAPYQEHSDVNGVEMSVGWDDEYKEYTISFPGMELGDEAREKGVHDQVVKISQEPELAKEVFAYTEEAAKVDGDVYELYKKVHAYVEEKREL